MLVITRREAEEIVIGDPKAPIGRIRIASIKGDRVRVACDFPREIPVHRKEVAQLIASGQTKEQATGDEPKCPECGQPLEYNDSKSQWRCKCGKVVPDSGDHPDRP